MSKLTVEKTYQSNKGFTRILVISDSHGKLGHAIKMIDVGNFDHVIHLGDMTSDAFDLQSINEDVLIHSVRGNCDFYDYDTEEILILTINGTRIFACHGHQYGVKGSLHRIEKAARKRQADIGLFGHSHRQLVADVGELILMNPGSISLPRDSQYPGCGILEIEADGKLHYTLHQIKNS